MVVDYRAMSSVNFAMPDFCSLIPNMPAVAGNFPAGRHWKRQDMSSMSGNPGAISGSLFEDYLRNCDNTCSISKPRLGNC